MCVRVCECVCSELERKSEIRNRKRPRKKYLSVAKKQKIKV